MTRSHEASSNSRSDSASHFDSRLAAYLASAGAASLALSTEAEAVVVGQSTNIPFGPANGGPGNIDIPIDLDNDGETDFSLNHKSNSLGEDYLELDKSPDPNSDFPDLNGDGNNQSWRYLEDSPGSYPNPLLVGESSGTLINPPAGLTYESLQDTDNYLSGGTTRRANRLIDYDSGVDEPGTWDPPAGNGNFLGSEGIDQYLPFQIEFDTSSPAVNYGWIGVNISDDATASGTLIGYAYETEPLTPITMGVVPEPGTMALAALGGVALAGSWITRNIRRK